jgi:hypothetical protein
LAATALGLGWLALILGSLLWKGFSGLSLAVFTQMTPPPAFMALSDPAFNTQQHVTRYREDNEGYDE